jgi:hypothetical protein
VSDPTLFTTTKKAAPEGAAFSVPVRWLPDAAAGNDHIAFEAFSATELVSSRTAALLSAIASVVFSTTVVVLFSTTSVFLQAAIESEAAAMSESVTIFFMIEFSG